MHVFEKNRYSLKSLKKITLLIRDVFHFYIISLKREVIYFCSCSTGMIMIPTQQMKKKERQRRSQGRIENKVHFHSFTNNILVQTLNL